MAITEIVVPLAVFATIFGILYVFFMTRNKERLALIEKGADASLFRSNIKLKMGYKLPMLLVGAGLGLFLGELVTQAGFEEGLSHFAMMLICGGLGLVIGGLIDKKQEDKKALEE